jgi:hypothetical protein
MIILRRGQGSECGRDSGVLGYGRQVRSPFVLQRVLDSNKGGEGNSMNRTNISFQEGMRMIATIPLLITLSLRTS